MTNENKPLLTLTEAAANRVKTLMKDTESEVIGLRIGIKTAGCSGMKYNVEYAREIKPFEERRRLFLKILLYALIQLQLCF